MPARRHPFFPPLKRLLSKQFELVTRIGVHLNVFFRFRSQKNTWPEKGQVFFDSAPTGNGLVFFDSGPIRPDPGSRNKIIHQMINFGGLGLMEMGECFFTPAGFRLQEVNK